MTISAKSSVLFRQQLLLLLSLSSNYFAQPSNNVAQSSNHFAQLNNNVAQLSNNFAQPNNNVAQLSSHFAQLSNERCTIRNASFVTSVQMKRIGNTLNPRSCTALPICFTNANTFDQRCRKE